MASENGLSLTYDSKRAAFSARFGLYTARNQNRKEMAEIDGSAISPWDEFRARVKEQEEGWVLLLERHSKPAITPKEVKEL